MPSWQLVVALTSLHLAEQQSSFELSIHALMAIGGYFLSLRASLTATNVKLRDMEPLRTTSRLSSVF
jgi:hypothetical protein